MGVLGAKELDFLFEDDHEFQMKMTLAAGSEFRISGYSKFILELLSGDPLMSIDGAAILNLGFRIHGQKLSADICGFRVLGNDSMDEILLLPLLNIGYRF